MMKKLMILGGSNCQLHALKRARERGIATVLIDYTPEPPGKEYADRHIAVSTFDDAACVEAARKEQVDGVLAVGTDQPVLTASRVAAALSLPSPLSAEEAYAVTNKRRMKEVYRAHGIRTPEYLYLTKDKRFFDADGREVSCHLRTPLVIKPLDSQGQRGVFKASSVEEVLRFLPETLSFSREESCLVEEYIESDEITVSGWVKEGRLIPLTIVDRLHYPDDVHIGVCTGHRYPSVHIGQKEEIVKLCEAVTDAFALREGPFYFQILRARDGLLFANEIACRIGGAFEDITIPQLTGFDILDAATDLALGESAQEEGAASGITSAKKDWEISGVRCFVALFFCRPGTIADITPKEEILSLPGVADCGYNFKAGDVIGRMRNATARFGHAVIFGAEDTIAQRVNQVYGTLCVQTTEKENLLLRL